MLNGTIRANLSEPVSIKGYLSSRHNMSAGLSKESTITGDIFKQGSYKTLYSSLSKEFSMNGVLSSHKTLSGKISVDILPEPYTGSYELVPKTVEQELPTRKKYMRKDVTVYEIPYAETSNTYGTTVVIAS